MSIDFNAVYEALAPYVGSTGMATTIVTIAILLIKLFTSANNLKASCADIDKLIKEGLQKVIPQNLYVKIEGVAKEEFAKMKAELIKEVNTKWLDQIKTNTELMQAMALAMCSMKAIPDSQKELLAKYLEIKPETTDALVVELVPTVETETKKVKAVIME